MSLLNVFCLTIEILIYCLEPAYVIVGVRYQVNSEWVFIGKYSRRSDMFVELSFVFSFDCIGRSKTKKAEYLCHFLILSM